MSVNSILRYCRELWGKTGNVPLQWTTFLLFVISSPFQRGPLSLATLSPYGGLHHLMRSMRYNDSLVRKNGEKSLAVLKFKVVAPASCTKRAKKAFLWMERTQIHRQTKGRLKPIVTMPESRVLITWANTLSLLELKLAAWLPDQVLEHTNRPWWSYYKVFYLIFPKSPDFSGGWPVIEGVTYMAIKGSGLCLQPDMHAVHYDFLTFSSFSFFIF